MKHITILCIASFALTVFLVSLAFGLVSLPVFLISSMTWIGFLMIYSYAPQTRSWLPRTAKARLESQAGGKKVSLPLAA
ncbi:MAG: hypothetical protein WC378_18570 [Opitutaceae bacterium]|jgi:hypothetical protein